MKKEEKRMILIICIVAIVIIGGLLILKNRNKKEVQAEENIVEEKYVEVLEDGTKLNKSNKLSEIRVLEGMEISNIQLTHRNGKSVVLGTVANKTNRDIGLTPIKLTLYDDKNNVIEEIKGLISPIKAGESVQLNVGITTDYANAYDLKIEKR